MSLRAPVGAVIACLDPPAMLVEAVREVLQQVDLVVVVDDGSADPTAVFAELTAIEGVETGRVTVLHQANAGVAAALNAGIRVAREHGVDIVLTLDQDSRLGPGYVPAALVTLDVAAATGVPVAFVSAESYSGHLAPTDGQARGGVERQARGRVERQARGGVERQARGGV
ncbi:MAG: glycosyltransferase, partial [Lapillicoccus sp.]